MSGPLPGPITMSYKRTYNSYRAGPNIPLNFPIIQIIIVHLSTLLFKRKLPKKADKMQMKHEYDQNVHVHFGQRVLGYMKVFSLL